MDTNFKLFGTAHIAILCSVLALAGLLAFLQRTLFRNSRTLRLCVAIFILIETAIYYGHLIAYGQLSFPAHLPLELCDASMALTIFALFTRNPLAYDLAYFWALAGAGNALVTPNLLEPWPSFGAIQFFISHGLTVVGVLYLIWSGQARPRPWSIARALIAANLFALVVGTWDAIFKTDYMYLRSKPVNTTLLDYLGPWPWYILVTEGVALVLFTLLYLPIALRRSPAPPEPAEAVATDA